MLRTSRLASLVVLVLLLAGCSTPREDADDDGVKDSVESTGRIITIQRLSGPVQRTITADANLSDTDGDGVLDGEEMLVLGTDPRSVDTDGDGLLDGADLVPDEETAKAWRAGGVVEVNGTFLGERSVCPAGGPPLKAHVESSDTPEADRLGDGEEMRGWEVTLRGATRRVTSDPCLRDTDGDRLSDDEEKALGTDPRSRDSDGDGAPDGLDADPVADLAIRFSNLTVETNRSVVRVSFIAGDGQVSLLWPGNSSATLELGDESASRDSLLADLIVSAEDVATAQPVALFTDPRGVILRFDLIAGTASGAASSAGGVLRFEGADGSMTIQWETARR